MYIFSKINLLLGDVITEKTTVDKIWTELTPPPPYQQQVYILKCCILSYSYGAGNKVHP